MKKSSDIAYRQSSFFETESQKLASIDFDAREKTQPVHAAR